MLDRKCHILPSYSKVQEAKLSCYPPLTSIEVENTSAKVKNLQDLLDHTTRRILMIESVCCKDLLDLVLYCKWGCDGSSGQSEYKQPLANESEDISDGNLFITSLVPIRIVDRTSGSLV